MVFPRHLNACILVIGCSWAVCQGVCQGGVAREDWQSFCCCQAAPVGVCLRISPTLTPFSEGKQRLFMKNIAFEMKYLEQMPGEHIMKSFGVCRDKSVCYRPLRMLIKPSECAHCGRGRLGKVVLCCSGAFDWFSSISLLLRQDKLIPWCYRVNLASQIVSLLEFISKQGMIHCDWKYDQVAMILSG